MKERTIVRLLDLRYFYMHKPNTYEYFTEKLKTRIQNNETIEIVLDDNNSFIPANNERLEVFLSEEIEMQMAL